MALLSTALAQADHPLRLTAQQRGSDIRAHREALWTLLLALLAALIGRPARLPFRYPALDPSLHMEAYDPEAAALSRAEEPRSVRRLRAWIGWILRGTRNRGMAPTGARPAPLRPKHTARAPPRPPRTAPSLWNPSRKPRLRRRRLTTCAYRASFNAQS